jgi:hypothetical protein
MEATPESMDFSPHEMRKKGMATLVTPNTNKGVHSLSVRGNGGRWMKATITVNISPNRTLYATRVMGPISATAIFIQRKDELHIAPSRRKTTQCFGFNYAPMLINNGG